MTTEEELKHGLEQAFDYRGDITLALKDGRTIEGYLFDRRTGPTLADSVVRVYPKDQSKKVSISYADITDVTLSGRDPAAGKSWEAWVKKYMEKKAAGEKHIELEPEKLD